MRHVLALALATTGFLTAAPAFSGEAPKTLAAGDPAPAFSLPGSDGITHALADHAGKRVVVVAWFPKVFTGGCTAECKSLRESASEIRAFDAAYYAASVDPVGPVTDFAKSLEADFPILADADGSVARAYGVVTSDRPRPFRWTFYVGKDGRLLYVDREVKAATAGPDIAKRLAELGVAKKSQ